MEASAPLGERIAYHRRRRGLSQVKLAGLIARSESWVSQVERGVRSIDRISVLAQVAGALNVPLADLAPDALSTTEQSPEAPVIEAFRDALTNYGSVSGFAVDPKAKLPGLEQVRGLVAEGWDMMHSSRFREMGELTPRLLQEVEPLAALAGPAREQALGLLSETYQIASAVLAKLAETDMAWVAADRAVRAAEQANAPLQAAAGAFRVSHVFLSGNRPEEARRVADTAAAALDERVDEGDPELLSVWGGLNLAAAVASTRVGDADGARRYMQRAEDAAGRLGEDRNDLHTEFGPTNVALHAVGVSVELGDAGEALRRAATIEASHLSPERRARFLIDVARAYGQRRRTKDAVGALLEAESLTPEQVRSHGLVRELVRDLLRGERRGVDPKLRGLARRTGVLP